ncbi:MAG: class I SAM-dependent methyltransferase [Clostridia bacterium]|nr:class I SAM-dependent methyltransferase [Clostridia bacterium]
MLINNIEFAHELITRALTECKHDKKESDFNNLYLCDFTMGNGNDTLFMSRLAQKYGIKIYAFDIQPQALQSTLANLDKNGAEKNYTLINDSHSEMDKYLPAEGEMVCGMFNLGYLPGGNKTITTLRETTLTAIEKAVDRLTVGGVLTVTIYPGHPEGKIEGELIERYLSSLSNHEFNVLKYALCNKTDPPYVMVTQKIRKKGNVL